jgi:hypothetical protein
VVIFVLTRSKVGSLAKNEKDVPHPVDALNAMGAQTFIDSFCSTASLWRGSATRLVQAVQDHPIVTMMINQLHRYD